MTWLRQNIHPYVMVTVGVQPTIAAGCIVRSTNKYFDFSLRENFAGNRDILLNAISEQSVAPTSAVAKESVSNG